MFVICNHMLVSGNLSGRLLVRNLQPCSSASLKKILRPFIAVDLWLMGVFATVAGDLITHTDAKTVSCVARITSTGKVIWYVEKDCSGVAVGANCVYQFHCGPDFGHFCALETLDLANGVQKNYSTVVWPSRAPKSFGSFKLISSADEAFLAVKVKNQLLCIYQNIYWSIGAYRRACIAWIYCVR